MVNGRNGTIGRRAFAGAAVGVALAGCADASGSADPAAKGVVLTDISVVNFDTEPHEFRLLVERDGEIVHWESYPTDAEDGASPYRRTISPDITEDRGDVTLHVRVDDKRSEATFGDAGTDIGCLDARIVYDPEAETPLRIFQSVSDCPDAESASE